MTDTMFHVVATRNEELYSEFRTLSIMGSYLSLKLQTSMLVICTIAIFC